MFRIKLRITRTGRRACLACARFLLFQTRLSFECFKSMKLLRSCSAATWLPGKVFDFRLFVFLPLSSSVGVCWLNRSRPTTPIFFHMQISSTLIITVEKLVRVCFDLSHLLKEKNLEKLKNLQKCTDVPFPPPPCQSMIRPGVWIPGQHSKRPISSCEWNEIVFERRSVQL